MQGHPGFDASRKALFQAGLHCGFQLHQHFLADFLTVEATSLAERILVRQAEAVNAPEVLSPLRCCRTYLTTCSLLQRIIVVPTARAEVSTTKGFCAFFRIEDSFAWPTAVLHNDQGWRKRAGNSGICSSRELLALLQGPPTNQLLPSQEHNDVAHQVCDGWLEGLLECLASLSLPGCNISTPLHHLGHIGGIVLQWQCAICPFEVHIVDLINRIQV
mmetsp:Transcript_59380/g.139086  ORF Transcript_59380/g.139086 Transcript_59380/m.139086 type:complete len:217 (+) Transcript_59380:1279-1929(+)